MAEKVLYKIGGTQGRGTFEVVDVDGSATLRLDGVPIETNDAAAIGSLEPIATPDAIDEATAVTLVNDCKATINAIIAALQG